MMNKIVNCIEIAQNIEDSLVEDIHILKSQNITPTFATILVGNNPASLIYVNSKTKKAKQLGIHNELYTLPHVTEHELISLIHRLNNNKNIHGILVQLPISDILIDNIINQINPVKDIDGLHPINMGYLAKNSPLGFTPCTPLGCLHIIKQIEPNLAGKKAVIIGRSQLVGIPMFHLLLHNNVTACIAHSHTSNLQEICSSADILVVAIGNPAFINKDYIKQDAIVIDVGINKVTLNDTYRIKGDVDLESVLQKVKYITPVPKGVGLLTIICLMKNIITACKLQHNII